MTRQILLLSLCYVIWWCDKLGVAYMRKLDADMSNQFILFDMLRHQLLNNDHQEVAIKTKKTGNI